jgi:subtilisin-like proprotein convertase family protein
MRLTCAHLIAAAGLLLGGIGCGPSVSSGDDEPGDGPDAGDHGECVPSGAELCFGGVDEDCDGLVDCEDPDCASSADCRNANCGTLQTPEASLALPDGEGNSYRSSINFSGFTAGQTLNDINHLLGVCVVMEHSWLRDLQINITAPNGRMVEMQRFLGQTGSELYMGIPIDNDGVNPTPGIGWEYCWTPTATNPPMLQWSNQNPGVRTLPSANYQTVTAMTQLVGTQLNGDWTLEVQDLWASDNGFIFRWGVRFDPAIVEDCSDWPPID